MNGLFFKKYTYFYLLVNAKNTDTVIIWTFRMKSIINNLNLIHYSIIIMMRETKA